MITKWTNGDYNGSGTQNNRDIWKWVKVKMDEVASSNASNKPEWFVPSIEEWAAVKGELIGSNSYSDFGLSSKYWSSSQYSSKWAWCAFFSWNINYDGIVDQRGTWAAMYVRLATTF